MKKILLIALAVSTVFQAKAQLFSPESLTGAALGGLIGGFSGGGHGHCGNSFSGNNAAIGAGIGLAAGALFGAVNRQNTYYSQPYGYAPESYPQSGYAYPAAPAAPAPRYNYMVGGTLVGAASGALIGSGIHHQAGEGALIGAGAGLVLGSIADRAVYRREQRTYYANQTAATTLPSEPVQQPQATVQVEENWPRHGPTTRPIIGTKPPASLLQN